MLINPYEVLSVLEAYELPIKGILHVGSCFCEEKEVYNTIFNISDEKIIWVDANKKIVESNIEYGIPNCYCAALDEVERVVDFHVMNSLGSSSLLPLAKHAELYPDIVVEEKRQVQTQTLKNFMERNTLDTSHYNFWNFDIQGAEHAVFKGSEELLKYADIIYTEVSTDELYKGCALIGDMDTLLNRNGLYRILTRIIDNKNWGDAIYARV